MTTGLDDREFTRLWARAGCSPQTMSELTGMPVRSIYQRRAAIERRTGIALESVNRQNPTVTSSRRAFTRQIDHTIDTGTIVVFSDAHWWPDQDKSIAHQALIKLVKKIKPRLLVANGDLFDGARVAAHKPMGILELPTIREELETCTDHLHELQLAAGKHCELFWTVGNHDQRFDKTLALQAGDYVDVVDGLESRFPDWTFAWSLALNGSTMIKHRIYGGIHAGYNNTVKAGWTTVTGHTHTLEIKPWGDYNGRRWGVQCGTLADQNGDQFEYTENVPSYSCQGFAILTYQDGILLPPELCEVIGENAYFRGTKV